MCNTRIHAYTYTNQPNNNQDLPRALAATQDETYWAQSLTRHAGTLGKKAAYLLSTGNLVSRSGLDLMQARVYLYASVYVYVWGWSGAVYNPHVTIDIHNSTHRVWVRIHMTHPFPINHINRCRGTRWWRSGSTSSASSPTSRASTAGSSSLP